MPTVKGLQATAGEAICYKGATLNRGKNIFLTYSVTILIPKG